MLVARGSLRITSRDIKWCCSYTKWQCNPLKLQCYLICCTRRLQLKWTEFQAFWGMLSKCMSCIPTSHVSWYLYNHISLQSLENWRSSWPHYPCEMNQYCSWMIHEIFMNSSNPEFIKSSSKTLKVKWDKFIKCPWNKEFMNSS